MKKIALFFFTLLVWNSSTFAQAPLIDALNKNLIAIESKQPNDTFANFDEFSKVLTNNKLLGLGEETHGVREFTDFRGTLIKYLVSKLNYKVIILEADFTGTQILNKYILNGKGNKYYALLATGMGIYRKDEFLNIVEWLKAYNLNKPQADKVSFYGCDMQKTTTIAYLTTGYVKLKKELSPEAKAGLKLLLEPPSNKIKSADRKLMQQLTLELNEEILKYPDTSLFKHNIYTIFQWSECFQEENNYKREKLRDKFMAENAVWIYEYELKKKTILLAHNVHLAKAPVYDDIKRMGNYLKETYKDEYYVLGFSFFTGNFAASEPNSGELKVFAMPEIKNPESTEYIFSQCSTPNFMLDFKTAQKNADINLFLTKKTYSKFIGASYKPSNKDYMPGYMPLINKFDGIAFFKTISPSSFPFPWDKRE